MVSLNDNLGFIDVQRIEVSDIALGGNEINSPNLQLKQLASRDKYLRDLVAPDTTAQTTFDTFKQAGVSALAQGRLTLATNDPTPSTDLTARTTLYYTPFNGDVVALWNGTRWDAYTFTERSLSLAGLAANTNFDIFLWLNGATLTLEAVAWSNSGAGTGARASAISRRNGVWVKTSDNRRYLGTIRTTGTIGQSEDSFQNRYVWNVQNQQRRLCLKQMLGVTQYLYATSAWRAANNDTNHQIRTVCGVAQQVRVDAALNSDPSGPSTDVAGLATCGIGRNVTNANSAQMYASRPNTGDQVLISAVGQYTLAIGYNFLQLIEFGGVNGSVTEGFVGEDPSGYGTSGIMAIWDC